MSVKLDRSKLDRFANDMATFQNKAARKATAAALTRTAKGAKLLAGKSMRKQMTLRNNFSEGSLRATFTTPSRPIASQFTKAGSISPYLAAQEAGGALPSTKSGRRITTSEGSREGPTAYPRKKLARGVRKTKNIRIMKPIGTKHRSKRINAAINVIVARKRRERFVYLDFGNDHKGLFDVSGRKIVMVHRIMRRRLRLKPNKWFGPAVAKSRRIAPSVFKAELERMARMGEIITK